MSNKRIKELLEDVRTVNANKLEYFRLYQDECKRTAKLQAEIADLRARLAEEQRANIAEASDSEEMRIRDINAALDAEHAALHAMLNP